MKTDQALLSAVFEGEVPEDVLVAHMASREPWTKAVTDTECERLHNFLAALESSGETSEDKRRLAESHPQALATCAAFAPAGAMLRMVYVCEQIDADMLPRAIDASHGAVRVLASWRYSYLRAITSMCRVLQYRHAPAGIELKMGV